MSLGKVPGYGLKTKFVTEKESFPEVQRIRKPGCFALGGRDTMCRGFSYVNEYT